MLGDGRDGRCVRGRTLEARLPDKTGPIPGEGSGVMRGARDRERGRRREGGGGSPLRTAIDKS